MLTLPDKVRLIRLKEQLRFDGITREVQLKIKANRQSRSRTDQPPRYLPDGQSLVLICAKKTVYDREFLSTGSQNANK